jgi:hypothetical protein
MHDHDCPRCCLQFVCDVPFCKGLRAVECDSCYDATAKIVPFGEGFRQVVDYVREREAKAVAA